ncbi:MAG TPA: hypothetical protein VFD68_03360, partial [Gemmatimonadales bacterium]|nr:hypothetical protein [Gemmatimonadales bacterium]
YQVVARFIGMAAGQVMVARRADEDRLVANIQLGLSPVSLDPVVVRGQRAERTPGAAERTLSREQVARLPIDATDLATLATLAPGVVGINATDSTDAAFSVAGQRPTANNITLDGLSFGFGSGSVPQDALRNTRVITSTYDVARGQFSGGLVASTTRSGTNVPQGSFTYTLRDRDLAWGGATSSAFGQGFTQNQVGGGMGGPIVPNRLFVFGALQGRWRRQALAALPSADPATLERLGVSPDSAARFVNIAAAAGVPLTLAGLSSDRSSDNTIGLLRLDWNISDAQTLTLRLDGRWVSQDPTRVAPLALPPTGATRTDRGGGVMASLTTHLGGGLINELRGYVSTQRRDASALVSLPAGRVQVASDLTGGGRSVVTLTFGGNGGRLQRIDNSSLEVTEELSWLPGRAAHRLKLGAYLNGTRLQENHTPNQLGTFLFPSLAALAADRPAEFTRTLAPLNQAGTAWNGALYLGDTWHAGGGFQLTGGARLEATRFRGAPAFNPLVDSLFGVRTDQMPRELHLSPRVGFSWAFGSGHGARRANILRGGVGDFRSPTPTSLYSVALAAPGLANAETELVCVGATVPTPDWSQYMQDPSTIPSQCVDTAVAVTIAPHPAVTAFAPDFTAPRAWRASLGFQRRLLDSYTVSVDAGYARGMSQYGFRTLNLVAMPYFTLPDEGSRPVYVPVDSIVPGTGVVNSAASRVHPEFGQVLLIGSDLESDTRQLTLGIAGAARGGGATFQVSYTYTRALDQSSFSCCGASQGFAAATTAGDPRTREWATSDFERRHSFLGTGTLPISAALEISAIGRLSSGVPFTPIVGSDINGDGARNDRAFVFDPATASDSAVANGMRALLAGALPAVRGCLETQLGRIAARNSCRGPWQPSLDFQINWRPDWFGLNRRLTLSVLTVNLLGGVDEWLHGAANLRGWGFSGVPDPVLLYVRGFDAASERFRYAVNGRFGTTAASNGGVTVPFQIGVQGHLAIGPDRARDRLRSAFGGRGGKRAREAPGAEGTPSPAVASDIERLVANPVAAILGLKNSLNFTTKQAAEIGAISATLDAQYRAVSDSLRVDVQKAGDRPDPGVLFGRMRRRLAQAQENIGRALERTRGVLTAEQWSKVPTALKSGFRL